MERWKNAGFSDADKTFRPVIGSGTYNYKTINVDAEKKDPNSLYTFITKMIALRKQCPEIGNGEYRVLDGGTEQVLCMLFNNKGKRLLVCHNFSDKPQAVSLKTDSVMENSDHQLLNLISNHSEKLTQGGKKEIVFNLQGYGFRWYRIKD